jgi:hypothetical protein
VSSASRKGGYSQFTERHQPWRRVESTASTALTHPNTPTKPPRRVRPSPHTHRRPLSHSGGARSRWSINAWPPITSGRRRTVQRSGTAAASFSAVLSSAPAVLLREPTRAILEAISNGSKVSCIDAELLFLH